MSRICSTRTIVGCLAAAASLADAQSGEPLVLSFTPTEVGAQGVALDTYDVQADPDAPFNRSGVALAPRVHDADVAASPYARPDEGRVMALVQRGPTIGARPQGVFGTAPGGSEFQTYTHLFWQYTDLFVEFGGSAGEANILIPAAATTDAAHRNGVPAYGTLFFAPNPFGGSIDRVESLLRQRPDGSFPIADRLIELAEYHGFDGYFFNQETSGGNSTTAHRLILFMRYMRDRGVGVSWYDSMLENGGVGYVGGVNDYNNSFYVGNDHVRASDSVFLDYRWMNRWNSLTSSASYVEQRGADRYDLYAGINTEGAGYGASVRDWPDIFPENGPHNASLALFRPDWTFNYSNKSDIQDYYGRTSRMWVGAAGDPSDTDGYVSGSGDTGWRGIARYIPARTPLVHDTFFTNFNTGHGFRFFADGAVSRNAAWNQLGLQDVLPTWQWTVHTIGTPISVGYDFADAWWGGSSLLFSGEVDSAQVVPLYMSRIPVHADTELRVVFKSQLPLAGGVQAVIRFDGEEHAPLVRPVATSSTGDWQVATVPLGSRAGKTIVSIGLRFGPNGSTYPVHFRLGHLAVVRGEPTPPAAPSGLTVLEATEHRSERYSARLSFQHSPDFAYGPGNPIDRYRVFQRFADGSRRFLNGASASAIYVNGITRDGGRPTVTIEVEAVGREGAASAPARLVFVPPGVRVSDVDGDGDTDVQDLLAYLRAFRARDADLDGDGDTDVQDLLAYLRAFRAGS